MNDINKTIKHFESLQKRYTTQHNGQMCERVADALEALNFFKREDIVTEIFDKIDKLLTKHVVMVSFQDGSSRLLFNRTLEIDIAELKSELLRGEKYV